MVRFKKGSAEAKAWGRKMQLARKKSKSTSPKKTSKQVKKGGVKMPRRKTTKRRSYKGSNSYNGSKIDYMYDGALPFAYGYVREDLSDRLAVVTNKIPLGVISDEVVLAGLSFIGHKKIKNAKVKKVLKNIFVIECSRGGQTVKDFGFKKVFSGQ